MTENVVVLTPQPNFAALYANYLQDRSVNTLSTASIAGICVGVILGVLLIVLIVVLIVCCRTRHPQYQSAYDTEEAQGNKFASAEHALQQKLVGHPDVKAELYI